MPYDNSVDLLDGSVWWSLISESDQGRGYIDRAEYDKTSDSIRAGELTIDEYHGRVPTLVDGYDDSSVSFVPEQEGGKIGLKSRIPEMNEALHPSVIMVWWHSSPWPVAVTRRDWNEAVTLGLDENLLESFEVEEWSTWGVYRVQVTHTLQSALVNLALDAIHEMGAEQAHETSDYTEPRRPRNGRIRSRKVVPVFGPHFVKAPTKLARQAAELSHRSNCGFCQG